MHANCKQKKNTNHAQTKILRSNTQINLINPKLSDMKLDLTTPVSCANDFVTILLLDNSSDNIPSYSWPNQRPDVAIRS